MSHKEYIDRWLLVVAGIAVGAEALALIQKFVCHMW